MTLITLMPELDGLVVLSAAWATPVGEDAGAADAWVMRKPWLS